MGDEQEKRQDDRHERIDVLRRVPREPTELVRRHVSIPECHIPVRVLMRDHREQQDGCDENECLDLAQDLSGIGEGVNLLDSVC